MAFQYLGVVWAIIQELVDNMSLLISLAIVGVVIGIAYALGRGVGGLFGNLGRGMHGKK